MTIIVKTAPMRIIVPVVPNMPTPVFADRSLNDFRKNTAVITTKTNKTTKAKSMYTTKFPMRLKPMFAQSICVSPVAQSAKFPMPMVRPSSVRKSKSA